MIITTPQMIGAFIKWLLKGCKSKLSDEIDGKVKGIYFDASIENWLIGLVALMSFIILIYYTCVI